MLPAMAQATAKKTARSTQRVWSALMAGVGAEVGAEVGGDKASRVVLRCRRFPSMRRKKQDILSKRPVRMRQGKKALIRHQ